MTATSRRVLYIVPSANIGGAETFLQHTAAYHRGYEPVYALLRDGVLKSRLREKKRTVEIAPVFPRLRDPLSQARTIAWLKDVADGHEAALIHSNMAYAALFGGVLSRWTGLPHFWFQHGPASGWMDTLAGALPHHTVLVNSRYTEKTQLDLERNIPRLLKPARRLRFFQLGVDLGSVRALENDGDFPRDAENLRSEILSRCSLPDGTPIAGMLCRLQEWKGVHLFLQAVAQVNKTRPLAGVVWGGSESRNESPEYFSRLERLIAGQKIPVHMAGPTAAPLRALAAIDIIVNASIQPEPFGLSIIEGLCMGAFPVVPTEGGAAEIVSLTGRGLTFRPRDANDLTAKLAEACKKLNPGERAFLSETARTLFDAEKSVLSLEALYDEAVSPKTPR